MEACAGACLLRKLLLGFRDNPSPLALFGRASPGCLWACGLGLRRSRDSQVTPKHDVITVVRYDQCCVHDALDDDSQC